MKTKLRRTQSGAILKGNDVTVMLRSASFSSYLNICQRIPKILAMQGMHKERANENLSQLCSNDISLTSKIPLYSRLNAIGNEGECVAIKRGVAQSPIYS